MSPESEGVSAVTVFLVDDHAMFRAGVQAELGGLVDVVGEAGTVDEAIVRTRALRPQVVLLDVHMPRAAVRPRSARICPRRDSWRCRCPMRRRTSSG